MKTRERFGREGRVKKSFISHNNIQLSDRPERNLTKNERINYSPTETEKSCKEARER